MLSLGEWIFIGLAVVLIVLIIFVLLQKKSDEKVLADEWKSFRTEYTTYLTQTFQALSTILTSNSEQYGKMQSEKIDFLVQTLQNSFKTLSETMNNSATQSETRLENIRTTLERSIKQLQDENAKKLDEMRHVVDEKLQTTLENRISESFKLVSERLEQVYKGLGEMQNLAKGVGDLKNVLTNVKTRGILGEIQLEAILEQLLSPEQYEKNIVTKTDGRDPVEFAIKLPGDDETPVYLPIDAKFPLANYQALIESYDSGSVEDIKGHQASLMRNIKTFAKAIHDKYIEVPKTTDFAIMFLPIEGLYAEVVKSGVLEVIQREYKVNVAGPTTMAALLNSLQMGFKTLAIQKRSGEVWKILDEVKTEFNKFGKTLEATQRTLSQANENLDKLVGVRTRQIQRKLKQVSTLAGVKTTEVIDTDEEEE